MTVALDRAAPRLKLLESPALLPSESVYSQARFWQRGAWAVCYRWLFPEATLSSPAPDPAPRRRFTAEINWAKAAPRWLMFLITTVAVGGWYEATSSRQSRLEQAIANAPSKMQLDAENRLTAVEGRMDRYEREQQENYRAMLGMLGAVNALTIEIREVKVELRLLREKR